MNWRVPSSLLRVPLPTYFCYEKTGRLRLRWSSIDLECKENTTPEGQRKHRNKSATCVNSNVNGAAFVAVDHIVKVVFVPLQNVVTPVDLPWNAPVSCPTATPTPILPILNCFTNDHMNIWFEKNNPIKRHWSKKGIILTRKRYNPHQSGVASKIYWHCKIATNEWSQHRPKVGRMPSETFILDDGCCVSEKKKKVGQEW